MGIPYAQAPVLDGGVIDRCAVRADKIIVMT